MLVLRSQHSPHTCSCCVHNTHHTRARAAFTTFTTHMLVLRSQHPPHTCTCCVHNTHHITIHKRGNMPYRRRVIWSRCELLTECLYYNSRLTSFSARLTCRLHHCRMASRRKLKLSTEDSEKIENMFVKVGKIGGISWSREKAGTWNSIWWRHKAMNRNV